MQNLLTLLFIFLLSCSSKEETKDKNEKTATAESKKVETVSKSEDEPNINATENESTDCDGVVNVYLNDPDQSGTNIRNAPNGKVIDMLVRTDENFEYFITCTEAKNGWFKIEKEITSMETPVILKGSENWIHGSVLGAATRNYGNESISVYLDANKSKIIYQITQEVGLSFLDLCQTMVKVKWKDDKGNHEGWIDIVWVCGNPLTNCS